MEQIFGYHNWPGGETGTVYLHDGPVMAAADNFNILFSGKAGHAAMPHLTTDPVQAVAHTILALNNIIARQIDPLAPAVISTCTLAAGQALNQIPTNASLGGTFRATTPEMMSVLRSKIAATAAHVAAMFGLTVKTEFKGYLPPTINATAPVELAFAALEAQKFTLERDKPPSMGAEDFGRFLEEIPGAYAWIGNGPSAGLHHPDFDYNDEILPIAARYLATTAKAALA
jgi:hippurate hydrolase